MVQSDALNWNSLKYSLGRVGHHPPPEQAAQFQGRALKKEERQWTDTNRER